MAQPEKLLIFLASPGDVWDDVWEERGHVEEVVDELNRTVASKKGVKLEVVTWENDTFSEQSLDAQALIDAQIAEMAKCSLFVGIMWKQYGRLTPRVVSKTEEEFYRAVAAFA